MKGAEGIALENEG